MNLGDDADTTGAVYGQLTAAFYGEDGIPAEWRARLVLRERIVELADGLFALADTGAPPGKGAYDSEIISPFGTSGGEGHMRRVKWPSPLKCRGRFLP